MGPVDAYLRAGSSDGWFWFWGMFAVLEWSTLGIVLWVSRRSPGRLPVPDRPVLGAISLLSVLALVAVAAVAQATTTGHSFADLYRPATPAQALAWVGVALTAAICEEVIFRGYAVCASPLARAKPAAVALSTAGFVYAHGGWHQGAVPAAARLVFALLACLLLLDDGSLRRPVFVHHLVNLAGLSRVMLK